MQDQTVSVLYDPGVSTWFVTLTIPLGDLDSITTLVGKWEGNTWETKVEAHAEAHKLLNALSKHNRSRVTYFATVSDSHRAAMSTAFLRPVPPQAFNLVRVLGLS